MQMFPTERQRSNIVTTRRHRGSNGSSPTKSPINSPMKRSPRLNMLIIHHAPLIRSGLAARIEARPALQVVNNNQ